MHRKDPSDRPAVLPLTRRRFVQGVAAGTAMAAVDLHGLPALGEVAPHMPKTLSGKRFDLTIHYMPVNFTGRRATAMAVNGSVPGPILRWREGDDVSIYVTNRLHVSTSVHWHSLRIPAPMDGVPGLTYAGIAPGETFHYHFKVKQNGTAWYHSHTRFQEQSGIRGPLILDPHPLGADPIEFDREHVIFLSDWTDTNPETVFSNLKEESDYYNYHKHTVPEFFAAVRHDGFRSTVKKRLAWAKMNMSNGDISDISAATYTYLLNGNPPNWNWTGLFKRGEKVRLRFINGSAMTFFDVRIPGLKMTVVQADGNDVEPVPVDRRERLLRVGMRGGHLDDLAPRCQRGRGDVLPGRAVVRRTPDAARSGCRVQRAVRSEGKTVDAARDTAALVVVRDGVRADADPVGRGRRRGGRVARAERGGADQQTGEHAGDLAHLIILSVVGRRPLPVLWATEGRRFWLALGIPVAARFPCERMGRRCER